MAHQDITKDLVKMQSFCYFGYMIITSEFDVMVRFAISTSLHQSDF